MVVKLIVALIVTGVIRSSMSDEKILTGGAICAIALVVMKIFEFVELEMDARRNQEDL